MEALDGAAVRVRSVVRARVEQVPPIRYFSAEEVRLMQAICDRLLPQDDRDDAHKIPVVNYIDDRLYNRRIDGYRFEDMPEDHEAHRLGLQAIEAIAQHMFHSSFIQLEPLVGQLAIEYPLTSAAPDPPKWCKRARSRRLLRLPFHTKGVGCLFQPSTVCSNQSMIS